MADSSYTAMEVADLEDSSAALVAAMEFGTADEIKAARLTLKSRAKEATPEAKKASRLFK